MPGLGLPDLQACTKFHQAFAAETVSSNASRIALPLLTDQPPIE